MSEGISSLPTNNIGSGSIETFSPVMALTKRKPVEAKPLRAIIGRSAVSKELSKDKGRGV